MSDDHLFRASSPLQEHAYRGEPRITALETLVPHDVMRGILLLRIHTDAGTVDGTPVVGHGETYYIPEAAAAVIHDWMAQRLLGADATVVESHWRFLYDRMQAFGGTGAELRALSAVDLALWDIRGQLCRQPVWKLLGGPVRDSVPIYNSCGGPFYGARKKDGPSAPGWPGHGDAGQPGPLEDNWSSMNAPGDLAEELIAAGYKGMKLWSFDAVYRRCGGNVLSQAAVEEGVAPFRAIRERVGDGIEVMLDGHGFFAWPAAMRITEAMREVRPLWVEDVLHPENLAQMAEFRREAGVTVAVSEMLVLRNQYREVLERQAADYVMIDPTWVGGISETRRIAELAQLYKIPVLMHDCTGPLTLLAGLATAMSVSGVGWQETVRAHIATLYPHLIDENVTVAGGTMTPPSRPGIGARWLDGLFTAEHSGYRCTKL